MVNRLEPDQARPCRPGLVRVQAVYKRYRHAASAEKERNSSIRTRKSITCYYMLYKGVATYYLNLLVISSCCFDTNSEMFLMIHLYQIAQLTTNGYYIFKQLSESVGQIMSQKVFPKTP